MLRKIVSLAAPYPSVREHLRAALTETRSAFRSFYMECFSSARSLNSQRDLKVNVGCGPLVRKGWVNVDLFPHPGGRYLDVRNGLPFADVAVSHIHCEHFLEHLLFDQAKAFLRECHRVLKPEGTMRIIVPDAEKYITAYCRNDRAFFNQLKRLGNATEDLDTPMKVINQMFHMGGGHKVGWDFETLSATAQQVGFAVVRKSCLGDAPPELAIDGTDDWRPLESLYVALRK